MRRGETDIRKPRAPSIDSRPAALLAPRPTPVEFHAFIGVWGLFRPDREEKPRCFKSCIGSGGKSGSAVTTVAEP